MQPEREGARPPIRFQRPRDPGRIPILFVAALLALASTACLSSSYPLDIFPEMHYQDSKRHLEPRRLSPPRDAVPRNGARPRLTFEQATGLANPIPQTPETLARAAQIYRVNCAMCHGPAGLGDGPMARYYEANPAAPVPPISLASPRVRQRTDGQLYWLTANGIGNMPPFGDLLSEQDLWAVVMYVRTVR